MLTLMTETEEICEMLVFNFFNSTLTQPITQEDLRVSAVKACNLIQDLFLHFSLLGQASNTGSRFFKRDLKLKNVV